jgi:hypothetical protein
MWTAAKLYALAAIFLQFILSIAENEGGGGWGGTKATPVTAQVLVLNM